MHVLSKAPFGIGCAAAPARPVGAVVEPHAKEYMAHRLASEFCPSPAAMHLIIPPH